MLKDVSFSAKKGETIAFIGSTGSGKSTLVNLIPRFYDVSEEVSGSTVWISATMIYLSCAPALRCDTAESLLFNGTIADNIRFGKPDATMEEGYTGGKNRAGI